MSDHRFLDQAIGKIFDATLEKLPGHLKAFPKESRTGIKLLAGFHELKKYNSAFVHKVTEVRTPANSFVILLIEKHLTIIETRKHGRIERDIEETEPLVIFSLPLNIGRVLIRKETFADKINDLLHKVDIDFPEHPEFSRNYYVVGDSPDMVRQHLPKNLIETLAKVKGLTVEINGNLGLLRMEKNLTEDVLLLLVGLGHAITE